MQQVFNQYIYLIVGALIIWILYLLAPILTPFLLGALLAYLADPLVKRLEQYHLAHVLSVIVVFSSLMIIFLMVLLLIFPIVQQQLAAFIDVLPQLIIWMQDTLLPLVHDMINVTSFKSSVASALPKAGWLFSQVLESGHLLLAGIINLILTFVVTFYLLRDWDAVRDGLKNLLPASRRDTILKLAQECDDVLSAFFRGQLMVMLALGLIYGIGLSLVGLKVGLMIGLLGGLLSIVPYLGSIFVVVTATLATLVQFGTWQPVMWVWGVFLVGQTIESYILTPYLVGERIGLHPVAVIFSVLAGGALFGFFGVLVALPVAAVLMVMFRFFRRAYQLN